MPLSAPKWKANWRILNVKDCTILKQLSILGLLEDPSNWSSSREYLEVYVSAVENAGHFWVQVLGSKAIQLDRLIENMTAHYTSPEQVSF